MSKIGFLKGFKKNLFLALFFVPFLLPAVAMAESSSGEAANTVHEEERVVAESTSADNELRENLGQEINLTPESLNQAGLSRVAVATVNNKTKEKELNNLLVSQGISHLLLQELYDTGLYMPVENNAEITDQVNTLNRAQSFQGQSSESFINGEDVSSNCDVLAYIDINKFTKSRLRGFLGPFSSAKVTINVEVEITLRGKEGAQLVASGEGKGTTKSKGLLFQVREDKVHFDKTSAGHAISEAVQQAVVKLINLRKVES